MGFLQAVRDLGDLEGEKDLEPYLKFPLEKEGRVIRVHLDVVDPEARVLDVRGVARVDVAHFQPELEMKRKYLYRDRVGSAAPWGFTPIHKMGRPKASREKNLEYLLGKTGDWRKDKNSHLFKIKNKLLLEYEAAGTLALGSVDRIMSDLEAKIEEVLSDLDSRQSHLVVFGVAKDDGFLYPGEVPAFVAYFRRKLAESLQGKGQKEEGQACAICGKKGGDFTVLKKVFKFSTDDKVNFVPGLEKVRAETSFPICLSCLEKTSGGRDRTERKLVNTSLLPGLRLWAIPETVGEANSPIFTKLLASLEANLEDNQLKSPGEKTEKRFFTQLASQSNAGLVFHFVCWERNNAQELVHFMVEDVPPERLAFLETRWNAVVRDLSGRDNSRLSLDKSLDKAINSLYATLSRFAGKSEADRQVFRDFALKIIARMLQGEALPVTAFKKVINARTGKLIFDNDNWFAAKESIFFAHIWAEFMSRVNERGKDYAARFSG